MGRLLTVIAVTWVCLSGCSPRGADSSLEPLQPAIDLFIQGQYESARDALLGLAPRLEDSEQARLAYLYLGRSHFALGEYSEAVEAFSTGRMLGGGLEFEQYLKQAQKYVGMSAAQVRLRNSLRRWELAAVIHRMFFAEDDRDIVTSIVDRGVMQLLPDGGFHDQDPVTHAAFYLIATRLQRAVGADAGVLRGVYPGGYRGAAAADELFVSGEVAVSLLQQIHKETR